VSVGTLRRRHRGIEAKLSGGLTGGLIVTLYDGGNSHWVAEVDEYTFPGYGNLAVAEARIACSTSLEFPDRSHSPVYTLYQALAL
jgi:hypothetical protein